MIKHLIYILLFIICNTSTSIADTSNSLDSHIQEELSSYFSISDLISNEFVSESQDDDSSKHLFVDFKEWKKTYHSLKFTFLKQSESELKTEVLYNFYIDLPPPAFI